MQRFPGKIKLGNSRYLKYSRENSLSVAGANLSIVPVSFWFSRMMFSLWLGDKLSRLWKKKKKRKKNIQCVSDPARGDLFVEGRDGDVSVP